MTSRTRLDVTRRTPMRPVRNIPLKTAIYTAGKTQRQVAHLAGLPETLLSDIVRGRVVPTPQQQNRLARVLRCSVSSLFTDAAA